MFQNYVKIAFRNLRSQRSYTLLNVVGLTVGMAGGLLIFLFVRYHLSTDRHHAKFDRIARIVLDLHLDDGSIEYYPEAPLPMAKTLRMAYPQVEQAAFLKMNRDLTVQVNRPGQAEPRRFLEHKSTAIVEPELFDILDYRWLQGDPKTALRLPNSVVLTESWAKKYFGNRKAIGQTLTLNHLTTVNVTGVLADPPKTTDVDINLFISLSTLKQFDPTYDQTSWYWINSTDRIYVTLRKAQAAQSLDAAMPALQKKQFGTMANVYQFHVQQLADVHFDTKRMPAGAIRPALLWSLGLVGLFLVLMACINFVNLATAQVLRRSKEVGIRKTLGSTRFQLIGQFLLETFLIVYMAVVLAVLLTLLLLPLFNKWLGTYLSLSLDAQTIGFIALLVSSVILLAGGYPSVVLSGFSPWAALKGKLAAGAGGRYSLRQGLIVLQFVVCQVLIVGALVVARQMQYIQQAGLGFRTDNVVIVNLPDNQKSLRETLKNELKQYADIKAVSASYRPPSAQILNGGSFKIEGQADWEKYPIRERIADSDYLETYGLTLLAGRNIVPSDTIREYLINEAFLKKLNIRDPQRAIGVKIQYHLSPVPLPIVGVVKDFHMRSFHDKIEPGFIASHSPFFKQVGIRVSSQNPAETIQHIRAVWGKLYPNDVFEYSYLDDQLATFYETETLVFRLVNVFTGIAILICCLGLYGLVSFIVTQRTKEIGVRKVLGASVASIVTLLSKDFMKLVLIAILLASPLAWWTMNQWLNDFAYKIQIDWWVFVLAGVLAVCVALLTVSFQSIKAALVNPVKSLRSE
ncbi:ABC transporter permease [Spirosoma terrae]|uniref:FtsX-like permease family protein n=1 Tax=Spirosoma terrae TaxID=1968276 RepID=A0A6L9LER8_9BACT|nr:ABC transporter permease [Spirosoma terrae]NDU97651.1 FtsX-like permease family protein [Spirosoma terrae]